MRRILCIDGGGIKGVFPASFLATIEDTIQDDVWRYFDLIVGTSTGGIIALALGLGMPAKEILTFYENLGAKIFTGNKFIRKMRWIRTAKYDNGPLKQALEATFRDMQLGQSKTRLVIPSLNLIMSPGDTVGEISPRMPAPRSGSSASVREAPH